MKTPKVKTPKAAKTVEELLAQICEATKGGNYVFRGENKKNGKICSTLYRHFQTIAGHAELQETAPKLNFDLIKKILKKQLGKSARGMDFTAIEKYIKENILDQLSQKANFYFSIERIQKELILKDVQEYVNVEDEEYTWAELQHYGGSTNRIDFSQDLAVSLFFACDGESKKDGRLILLDKKAKGVMFLRTSQNNRMMSQKSVFVKRDGGYIEEHEIKQIIIPKHLKSLLITYVQNYFDIRTETMYADLTGYIQNQERHSDAYKQFFIGLFYYDDKQFKKAIKCYTQAIKMKLNFAAAYSNRGDAKMKKIPRDLKGAFADYNDAIARNPNHAGAYNNRSAAYNERGEEGDYDLAIADSNKAIELNPNYAEAYNNRGGSYGNKGEDDLAIADFSKAIELNPNYAMAYDNRAQAYCNKGDFNLAIADFSKCIHLNPKDATAYNKRGRARFYKDDYDRAIVDFSKAIELNLNYDEAYNNRGEVYGEKRKYDRAIADFNKAIALNPKYARAYFNLGITQRILQHDKEAKKYFKIALPLAKKQKNESLVAEIQKEIYALSNDSDS